MPGPPLSEQMRAARIATGLSIAEAARRAGTSRATLSAYERGTVSPSLSTASRVLAVCGASLVVVTGAGRR